MRVRVIKERCSTVGLYDLSEVDSRGSIVDVPDDLVARFREAEATYRVLVHEVWRVTDALEAQR